jgi:hypothetical protein
VTLQNYRLLLKASTEEGSVVVQSEEGFGHLRVAWGKGRKLGCHLDGGNNYQERGKTKSDVGIALKINKRE